MASSLRVIVLKPGKYGADGYVQRFRHGFMPNSTVSYLASLTPPEVDGARCLAPLPRSLALSASDEALNRRAKLPIAI